MDAAPVPAPVATLAPPTAGTARWRAGSLVYTAGGLGVLFLLLLIGDFAWSLKDRGVAPVFQVELRRQGASDFLVGLLIGSLPAFIAVVVTPVVGVLSDRARTRWGRRIPFLALPTPLIVLALIGMACTTDLAPWLAQLAGGMDATTMTLILYGTLWTVFEVATLVANAVFTGLVNDVVPPALIGRFFGLFRVVSLGAGIFFNTCVIGHAEQAFHLILSGIAAIYALGFTAMCWWVREGTYPPPPPRSGTGPVDALGAYGRQVLGLGYYRWVYAFIALAAVTFLPVNTFSIFAAQSYGLTVQDYGRWMAGAFVVSLVAAYPMGVLADRFHPLRVGAAALVLYLVAMLLSWLWVHDGTSYGVAFAVHVVISGAFFTATAALGSALFPGISFSQFAAAGTIATAVATMVVTPIVGRILDLLGRPYGLTFPMGALLAAITLVLWLVVWRRFQGLGGPRAYAPPQPGLPA